MRLKFVLLIGLVIMSVILAGCGSSAEPEATDSGNKQSVESQETTQDNAHEDKEDLETSADEDQEVEDAAAKAAAKVVKIDIAKMAYQPSKIEVAVGSKVVWTNSDDAPHDVHADDNSFRSGNLAKGETFTQEFHQAGEVTYHCHVHAGQMPASITVK